MDSEESSQVATLLHVLIDEGEIPFTELPTLLEALESDDRATRIAAAWALCLVAEHRPGNAEYVYSRLAGHDSFAALLASNWLLKHYGEEWLDDSGVVDVDDGRGNPVGRQSVSATHDRTGAGGGGTVVDQRRSDDSNTGPEASTDDDDDADESQPDTDSEEPTPGSASARRDVGRRRRLARDPRNRPPRADEVVTDGKLNVRAESTDPESVRLITRLASDRYTWTYVGVGKLYGRMQEFLLRVYVPPTEIDTVVRRRFEELIDSWSEVDDLEGVSSVIDWGTEPNPWVLTDYANATVRSVNRLEPREAFQIGLEITAAVADVHATGTRHGALSPSTVMLDRSGDAVEPRIVDVGLGTVLEDLAVDWCPVREPECAPELRQREYGGVDWMTDIYHLGVVLYTLFTGRSLESDTSAGPSAIPDPTALESELPPAADRIVGKATGAHKVMRYETVDELGRDLLSAIEDNWGDSE